MTYANGAPHPGDGRAYSDGGLVGHDVQVDLERRHQQLKLLRELEDATRRNHQQQQQQPRPVYSRHPTPVPRLGVGPVIWNAVTTAPASSSSSSSSVSVSSSAASAIAGRAPVLQTTKQQQQEQEQEQQQRRRFAAASAGHVAPSIHTILEIARSSSGSHGQPSSSSMPLTNTSRYYSKNPDQQHRQRPSASSEVRGGSSSSAGVIRGPRRPAHKAPEERDQVSRQQKGSSIPTASASGVVPSPPPQQQPVGTVGTFGRSGTTTTATTTEWSTPLRRGKWTKAEEEFAAATIRYFCGGLLNLQFGTLLRGFLAQQLHCHPMRISKKLLPGTTFCGVEISRKLGRRAYSPRWCDSPLATQQKLDAEDHLVELRAKFIASIEEEAAADSDELGEETRELCRAAERLSETSESRASTGTASAAGSPPSDVKSETTRAGSPAVLQQQQRYHHLQQASQQQQPQMYQYNQQQQQQQVVGQKRTRGDNEWAAAEQAQPPRTHQHHHQQQQQVHHHNQHQPQHPMHHQHQHSLYIPSQATNQRWGASPPVRSGPAQIWHSSSSPSPPRTPPLPSAALAGAHAPTQPTSYYENVPRPAKLPRLHHHQQQQQQTQHQQYHQQVSENVHEPQRSSAPSPPSTLPLLPSLRASLQRASTYQDQQQQQQQQGHQQHPHQQHRL